MKIRSDTDQPHQNDPSLFVSVRLRGSPFARDSDKYREVFTERVKCWRSYSIAENAKRDNNWLKLKKSRLRTTHRASPRPTVENFSKGTWGTNDRSIIILTRETTKLSALLATSTEHMCIRRSLSHEVPCVGQKGKRKRSSPATYCWKQLL